MLLYATVCSNTFQPEIRHRISAAVFIGLTNFNPKPTYAVFIGLTTQNYEQKMEIGSKIKMKKVLKKKGYLIGIGLNKRATKTFSNLFLLFKSLLR